MEIQVKTNSILITRILFCHLDYDTVNDHYDSNCSQFVDDMDILRQLPFQVLVEPDDGAEINMSFVQLHDDMKTVRLIVLSGVPLLPSSLFCLSKLDDLTLFDVPLKDGKFIFEFISNTICL